MPYSHERLLEMGKALDQARRDRRFPLTKTPEYNLQAVIDDYEDLQRLNATREAAGDPRDHAFHPDISRLYVEIKRRIQDRDFTQGEVVADSNVRARLSGLANSTGAETGMYNLMRHAMNSVLRLNNLTLDSDSNIVDAVAARVVGEIRSDVQAQVARGEHNIEGVNMSAVVEEVFGAIEHGLGDYVNGPMNTVTNAQLVQLQSMNNVTHAQNMQVNAIASHVGAIDNHVHAMGNNVGAMSSLVNSTNGNVTALTTNVGSLQAIVNLLPQMVANAVGDSVREMIPDIVGPAVEHAFEGAISNELITRLQAFARAVQEARAREDAARMPLYETSERPRSHGRKLAKKSSWFGRLNIFKKHIRHHSSPACMPAR
ncbi:hypothetical protein HD806DRAFT_519729 [Xylariaceae sp. AK1471]|nr:hypothetical protein HD806DRAFT_519729 [Xylariaceae sp. AK1471]